MAEEHPKSLRISDYTYHLPEEKIALFPKDKRDQSKLLILRNGDISQDIYAGLSAHVPANSRLVFNNTRVIQARLLFRKPTGAMIEIFLLEPDEEKGGLDAAIRSRGKTVWKCLIGGAGKWKTGQILTMLKEGIEGLELQFHAAILGKNKTNFIVEFTWRPETMPFYDVLHQVGNIPIPPYLKRSPETNDGERYQTIYAAKDGSVAAPTAGLHFTDELMASLSAKQIACSYLTLHVGAGTFLPVKAEVMEGHAMHAEFIDVDTMTIREMISAAGQIFAVGTTSLRTLESLYWMGVKVINQPEVTHDQIWIRQWEIYEELASYRIEPADALKALLKWMEKNELQRLLTKTEILIAPPYKPKTIAGLITNFHQPNSTLLLLVAAIIGDDWKRAYNYALENDFRFLSYGDGCLLYVR